MRFLVSQTCSCVGKCLLVHCTTESELKAGFLQDSMSMELHSRSSVRDRSAPTSTLATTELSCYFIPRTVAPGAKFRPLWWCAALSSSGCGAVAAQTPLAMALEVRPQSRWGQGRERTQSSGMTARTQSFYTGAQPFLSWVLFCTVLCYVLAHLWPSSRRTMALSESHQVQDIKDIVRSQQLLVPLPLQM